MVKYQVFISSTYEDLILERNQVIKAVLEMGHIPVGMEMFSAADEEQWKIIQRNIAASDYYVVLIAHRYGSMDGATSYTEKEYDFAVSQGIPTIGFIIHSSAPWPADKSDDGSVALDKRPKLNAFKEKVKKKPVGLWKNADDLHAQVVVALTKTFLNQPRTGWVPANEARTVEELRKMNDLQEQVAVLSKQNRELSDANQRLVTASTPQKKQLAIQTEFPALHQEISLEWEMEEAAKSKSPDQIDRLLQRVRAALMTYLKELDQFRHIHLSNEIKKLIKNFDNVIRENPFKGFSEKPNSIWYHEVSECMSQLDTFYSFHENEIKII